MTLPDRYARHRLIDGWNQERLRASRVMVAGAGAIGNEVIKLLALLGVGHILIVDFDEVEISNLTRSPLFREADAGRPKASVAAERAMEINPDIAVRAIDGDLQFDVGLGVYRSMDLVIGCLDSLDARLALNRACLRMGTPWINGAIEVTVAEVSLFRAGMGACFECSMSESMWERRSERFSCSGLRSGAAEAIMPTTAVVASLAAGYLVQEALFLLHADGSSGKEGLRYSQKITVNLKPYETSVFTLPVNADCLAHDLIELIETRPDTPRTATVLDLLEWAGSSDGIVEIGFDLITEMRCVSCGAVDPICRPLERCTEEIVWCPACGSRSRHTETLSWIDAAHPLSRAPLAELAVPDHAILCVKNGDVRRYFQLGGQPLWDSGSLSPVTG